MLDSSARGHVLRGQLLRVKVTFGNRCWGLRLLHSLTCICVTPQSHGAQAIDSNKRPDSPSSLSS
jgi:hypothetical protein